MPAGLPTCAYCLRPVPPSRFTAAAGRMYCGTAHVQAQRDLEASSGTIERAIAMVARGRARASWQAAIRRAGNEGIRYGASMPFRMR